MVMKINTVGYLFREAFTSLRRNGWLAVASAATAAIALMILGASLLMVVNANSMATAVESDLEIAVFLNTDLGDQQVYDLGEQIKHLVGVKEVTFVSKDDALAGLKDDFSQKKGVLETLGENNPLPDKYRVKLTKPEQVKSTALTIEKLQGVEQVKYGQGVVEKLLVITRWIRMSGVAVMALLSLAAVFLISTTIRLTVFARRKEISIMKYLGATDWFIRWPFVLEGIMLGLVGALVSVCMLYLGYHSLVQVVTNTLPFLPMQSENSIILNVYELIIALGVVIGALGSLISVRKYLKV